MKKLRSQLVFLTLATAIGGCAPLRSGDDSSTPLPLRPSASTEAFDAISDAQKNNSVVLQVMGAEKPVRVLPLPENGQPVYVSDLLRQSGLSAQFGEMQAVLYRNSPDAIGGIRMGIRFRPGTNVITPEHDYCLRPGDRLQVAEVESSPWSGLFGDVLPTNARRAAFGF